MYLYLFTQHTVTSSTKLSNVNCISTAIMHYKPVKVRIWNLLGTTRITICDGLRHHLHRSFCPSPLQSNLPPNHHYCPHSDSHCPCLQCLTEHNYMRAVIILIINKYLLFTLLRKFVDEC